MEIGEMLSSSHHSITMDVAPALVRISTGLVAQSPKIVQDGRYVIITADNGSFKYHVIDRCDDWLLCEFVEYRRVPA